MSADLIMCALTVALLFIGSRKLTGRWPWDGEDR